MDTKGDGDWSFVVDTDAYAGNFERALAAYVIGARGEYNREEEAAFADAFDREVAPPLCEDLSGCGLNASDDVAHYAPQVIYPTPGWGNDGHGKHYRVTAKRPAKYPAYQSVRMFLTREPTPDEIALLKARATAFAARRRTFGAPFKVLGFRLVRERTVTDERAL